MQIRGVCKRMYNGSSQLMVYINEHLHALSFKCIEFFPWKGVKTSNGWLVLKRQTFIETGFEHQLVCLGGLSYVLS